MIAFWVVLSLLVPLLVLVIAVIIIQLYAIFCRKKSALELSIKDLIQINQTVNNQTLKNNVICCCATASNDTKRSDGPSSRSENGFSDRMAQKFVDAIVKVLEFGNGDSKIGSKLRSAIKRWVTENVQLRSLSGSPGHVLNGGMLLSSMNLPAHTLGNMPRALSDITKGGSDV